MLAAMTFRTPKEAVELANNTVYGLASCVWSENINVALHVAAQLKAGVVWVNCTNLFDAACGFGGYRESGYGREGGREGLLEYMEPKWFKHAPKLAAASVSPVPQSQSTLRSRARPPSTARSSSTSGASRHDPIPATAWKCVRLTDRLLGEASLGNRKDIRNAVEAARKAESWAKATAHNRAQVLFYCAENLALRRDEITQRLASAVGEQQAKRGSRTRNRAHLLLCGMGRQVRWRGSQSSVPQYRDCNERAHWHRRRDMSVRRLLSSGSFRWSCLYSRSEIL